VYIDGLLVMPKNFVPTMAINFIKWLCQFLQTSKESYFHLHLSMFGHHVGPLPK
jgi:hypothetical protein